MASEPSRDSVLLNMMDVAEDYQSASVHEGYANQPDKNVKLDVLEGQAAENIETLREEMTTDEYGREILDISDVSEEFNNSAVASLSLNVNETEMDILNISTSDDEDVENEKADQSVVSDTKEDEMEQKSDIHCALCNDYFDCPKLLECFHTFCQSCLLKKIKSSHKFIFCPICRHRSNIPKEGIEKLIDNVVAASLVAAARKEQAVADCIVCKLHNEQKASVGQCLDCSDMMCQDCCEKHTYSRLTAKHKVVTFEEMKSEKYAGLLKETRTVSCMHHSAEIAEYFCSNCYIPVCKECSISGHSLHSCETLTDAVARKKVALKEMMESLKQESDIKLVDDSKESEILISEFEENEFKKLRDVKEKMISIIEQKYNKCAERLQNEFDIKRRKYCKHKRNFILKERKIVDSFLDSLSFILREGSDVECAMLEKFVESAVEHRRRYLSKVRPKLSRKSNFPSVFLYKEHLNVLEGLTFFTTNTFLRDQKDRERKAHTANATMHVENAEVRMKIGSSYQTSMNNVPVDRKPVYKSGEVVAPKGRGFAFQGIANPRQSMSYNRPSLLGQCPAQNRQYEYQDFSSENSYLSNGRAQNFGNYYTARNTGNKNSLFGGPPFRLNLLTSFDVKISQDQKVPDISGLAFIHLVNFAVADARNHRLKIFNINGKLIRYIDDPGPMSVTFCDKHLIWSSQFSAIRVKCIHLFSELGSFNQIIRS